MAWRICVVSLLLWICALISFSSEAEESPIYDRATATKRLRAASIEGWTKMAEQAIRFGAEVDNTDEYGNTPLILASIRGHERIVKMLLDAGANPGQENDDHVTPMLAASANCNDPVVSLLLHHGANVNVKSMTRQTPIMRAAENGCGIVVQVLMKAKGIDLRVTDDSGKTALEYAQEYAHETMDLGFAWVDALAGIHRKETSMRPSIEKPQRIRRPVSLPRGTDSPRSIPPLSMLEAAPVDS